MIWNCAKIYSSSMIILIIDKVKGCMAIAIRGGGEETNAGSRLNQFASGS